MHILFDLKTIIALVCIVLALLCTVWYFVSEKVREWRKRRARKLLADDDIARYERQIKNLSHYQDIVEDMCSRETILCPTLLKGIVDMLPDPNRINGRGKVIILQGQEIPLFIAGRGEVRFQLKFVADADNVPTHEKGLTVMVEPLGVEVRFTLKIQNLRKRIQGVDVDVNSWYWDLRFSGIQLISDKSFERIIDFISCSGIVHDAIGIPRFSWKPSDEHFRALKYAIEYFKKKKNDVTYLESLYEGLNKLVLS